MTEDDTFKRLKSLTYEEVDAIYNQVMQELLGQHGHAVFIGEIRKKLDPILAPYGWSYQKYLECSPGETT